MTTAVATTTVAAAPTTTTTNNNSRRVSYFYDIEIGNYHYGQGKVSFVH